MDILSCEELAVETMVKEINYLVRKAARNTMRDQDASKAKTAKLFQEPMLYLWIKQRWIFTGM